MNQTQDQLILVDLYDHKIGTISKSEAHCKPLLHRAFSVFLFRKDEMLLQKRARDKYHSGGLWTNACCSHPRPEEDLAEAARNRTILEVGADCQLREEFSFVYCHRFHEALYEYEYDHVFTGRYDGPLCPNPEEVEELRWVPFAELEQWLLERPQDFSVWFLTAAPKVLSLLRSRQEN